MSLAEQLTLMEAGVRRLQQRYPELQPELVLVTRLVLLLGREFNNMRDDRLQPLGLNEVEFRALLWLLSFPNEGASPGGLCSKLGQSPANITRLTDILVERGLVAREPDEADRRRLILRVTPQGEQVVSEVLPSVAANLRSIFTDFSDAERALLLTLLKRLAEAMDLRAAAAGREITP